LPIYKFLESSKKTDEKKTLINKTNVSELNDDSFMTCKLASQNSTDQIALKFSPFICQKLRSDRQKAISAQISGFSSH
jgi:hypothetical protein